MIFCIFLRFLILLFFLGSLFSCGGPCKNFEEENSIEFRLRVESDPKIEDENDLNQYWTKAGFYITKEDLVKIEIEGSANLCAKNIEGSLAETIAECPNRKNWNSTAMSVNANDYVNISVLKSTFNIDDCSSPPAGVHVWDVNACRNGFSIVVDESTGEKIEYPKYEGRTMSVKISPTLHSDSTDTRPRYANAANILHAKNYPPIYTPTSILIPEFYFYEKDGDIFYDSFPKMSEKLEAALRIYAAENKDNNFEDALEDFRCYGAVIPSGEEDVEDYIFDKSTVTFIALNEFCKFSRKIPLVDCETLFNRTTLRSISISDYEPHDLHYNYAWYAPMTEGCSANVPDANLSKSTMLPGSFLDNESDDVFLSRNSHVIRLKAKAGDWVFPNLETHDPGAHFTDMSTPYINEDYFYKIENSGPLSLYADHAPTKGNAGGGVGGYKLIIRRMCPSHENLYMYISEENKGPGVMPGDGDSIKIPLPENDVDYKYPVFRINEFHEPKSGWVFFGIKDNGDGYENNEGYYDIKALVPKSSDRKVTKLVKWVEEPLIFRLFGEEKEDGTMSGGIVNSVYERLVRSNDFYKIISAASALLISFYAAMFALGMAQVSFKEIITTVIKIAIVWQLLQENSWEFFNTYLFRYFTEGAQELIGIMTTPPGTDVSKDWNFAFFDLTMGIFLEFSTWVRMLAFLFAGPIGWLYLILYLWGSYVLVLSLMLALLTYFATIVTVGVLLSVAPVFIICILFKYTSNMFHSWIKIVANASFHAIFVFSALSFLSVVAKAIIDSAFSFGVCAGCVGFMSIASNVMPFCFLNMPLPEGFSNDVDIETRLLSSDADTPKYGILGIPISFGAIIAYLIMCNVMKKFVFLAADISSAIFGVFAGAVGGSDSDSVVGSLTGSIKYLTGMDEQSKFGRADKLAKDEIWRDVKIADLTSKFNEKPDKPESQKPEAGTDSFEKPSDQNPESGKERTQGTSDTVSDTLNESKENLEQERSSNQDQSKSNAVGASAANSDSMPGHEDNVTEASDTITDSSGKINDAETQEDSGGNVSRSIPEESINAGASEDASQGSRRGSIVEDDGIRLSPAMDYDGSNDELNENYVKIEAKDSDGGDIYVQRSNQGKDSEEKDE